MSTRRNDLLETAMTNAEFGLDQFKYYKDKEIDIRHVAYWFIRAAEDIFDAHDKVEFVFQLRNLANKTPTQIVI
jgi:hypothetical protein